MDGLLLDHIPPATVFASCIVRPVHTLFKPDIVGSAVTVLILFTISQPIVEVYVIRTDPKATPVKIPVDDPMVAIEVFPLCQVPPVVVLLKVILDPVHTDEEPIIGLGLGETVNVLVTLQVPNE